ncbi:MAG: alpha/beta hydrolase family protein [Acidimicrobiales bacterium]
MGFDYRFPSGSQLLAGHLAVPPTRASGGPAPGLVLCHGYPVGVGGAATSAKSFPELADRIARELGWVVLAFTLRGAGASEGDFSIGGWLDDVLAAVDHLVSTEPLLGVWAVGFGSGGSLAICAAGRDRRIRGVAAVGAPADFDDWAGQPRRLLQHAREIGLIKDDAFPQSFELWARPLRDVRALQCVTLLPPRSLLVVHGTDDDVVPDFDARVVADAHGAADLKLIPGAGHRLRHDPRVVAVLLGWLDRERHSVAARRREPAPAEPVGGAPTEPVGGVPTEPSA